MTTTKPIEKKNNAKPNAKSKSGGQITTNGEVQKPVEKRKPDYNVFAIVPDKDATRIGANIGCVFNHKSGSGFKIFLDAAPFPMNGKIQLIAFEVK